MDPLVTPTIDMTDIPDGHAVFFCVPAMHMQVMCIADAYKAPSAFASQGTLAQVLSDPALHIRHTIKFRTATQARQLASSLMHLAAAMEEDQQS